MHSVHSVHAELHNHIPEVVGSTESGMALFSATIVEAAVLLEAEVARSLVLVAVVIPGPTG